MNILKLDNPLFNKKNLGNYSNFIESVSLVLFTVSLIGAVLIQFANTKIGYDTGLYHLQKIYWLSEYGHTPGLANLDGRLGFYSIYFYIASFIYILFNSIELTLFINLVSVCAFFISISFRIKNEKDLSFKLILIFSTLSILFYLNSLKSLYQDIGGLILIQLVLLWILKLIHKNKQIDWIKLLFLLAIIVSVKFSYVFLLSAIAFVFFNYSTIKLNMSSIGFLIGTLFLIGLFIYHNVVLTGWLIYPFSGIDLFSFDWKVPKYLVVGQEVVTKAFAKVPGTIEHVRTVSNMSFFEWIPMWWKFNQPHKWLIIGVIISQIINYAFVFSTIREQKKVFSLQVVNSFCLLAWFMTAPSLRFGFVWFFMSFTISIYLMLNCFITLKNRSKVWVYALMVLVLFVYFRQSKIISYLRHGYPQLSFNLKVSLPEIEMRQVSIPNSSEVVFVPQKGELTFFSKQQPVTSRIFNDAILPFINDIPRRRGQFLTDGFYSDPNQSIRGKEEPE